VMPDDVREVLIQRDLRAPTTYSRHISATITSPGWLEPTRHHQAETVRQMLEELAHGDV
jgi:hypothetical protein